jgi:hypothetical protein
VLNLLRIDVPEPAELLATGGFGAGALIRVESATAAAGPWTEIGTTALSATVTSYLYCDATGTDGTWYRWRISNAAGILDGDYSDPWQVIGGVRTGLCLLENVRRRLGYPEANHNDDIDLDRFITAVTRVVSNYTGRQFVGDVTDGVYLFDGLGTAHVRGQGRVLVVKRGIGSVTTLEIAPATGYPYAVVNPVDYFLRPSIADRDLGWPATKIVLTDVPTQLNPSLYINIPSGHDVVRLTGRLGWVEVPPDIEMLAENQVVRLWQARLANGSDQVGNSALGVTTITRNWSIDERRMLEEGYRDYAEG